MDNFFEKHKRESYNKVIFIGDGSNDFCFSKHLNENDILFPRKNFSLYNILYNDNKKNKIKAEIHPWENGIQIVDVLKKLDF
jgi:pyridoxal phosphate phosphatase PHOSPHO2